MRKILLFIIFLISLSSIDLVYSTHCSGYTSQLNCKSDGGTGYDCCVWDGGT